MISLKVKQLSKYFGDHIAVNNVSFSLDKGQIACLLGPSGCGKTTLLRTIAGFEEIREGEIWLENDKVSTPHKTIAPESRQVGMVFQDFALFPHLSIEDNIGFGIQKMKRAEKTRRISALMELINLSQLAQRYPHELSGGQQQRVALARALAPKPKLLLMDEPFSSMDVELREELARDVRVILKKEGTTAILVTHDQHEAFAMTDAIGVMNKGRLIQWDSGYNLYHKPANEFVADFIGQGVFLDGTVVDKNTVKTELADLIGAVPDGCQSGCPVRVLVRPDDIIHDDNSPRTATIKQRNFRGASYIYTLELESGTEILSLVHSHHNHAIGEQLGIKLEIDHLVIFPNKKLIDKKLQSDSN